VKYYRKYQLIKHMSSRHPLSVVPDNDDSLSLDPKDTLEHIRIAKIKRDTRLSFAHTDSSLDSRK
jgi:hypothetical protein